MVRTTLVRGYDVGSAGRMRPSEGMCVLRKCVQGGSIGSIVKPRLEWVLHEERCSRLEEYQIDLEKPQYDSVHQ